MLIVGKGKPDYYDTILAFGIEVMTDRETEQITKDLIAAGDDTPKKKDHINDLFERLKRIVQLEELRKQEIEKIL